MILAAVLVLTRCSEDTARCRLPALTLAHPRRRSRILEALLTLPYAESRAALHSVCSLPPSPLLEAARHRHFTPGAMESIQTVVQIERGFRLSLRAMPMAATQQLMGILTTVYPSITSRILIVNLPGRPKAVRENLAVLMPLLGHALKELE